VGRIPHLCAKSGGGTKWLYGMNERMNESYDKYGDNRLRISADKLRGLRAKSGGDTKWLYGLYKTAEFDIGLGSGY
jgi:hypothetical protein